MARGDTSAARAARQQKRSDDAADRRQRGEDPDLRAAKPALRSAWLLALGLAFVLLVWAALSSGSPKLQANLAGLVPWKGGRGWRTRGGQFIDPEAVESLLEIGESLAESCTPVPMTLDISREQGGLYPPHLSHQQGRDVDIRMSDLTESCRRSLQTALTSKGWRVWYDGPDALAPTAGGRHISHLHARFGAMQ